MSYDPGQPRLTPPPRAGLGRASGVWERVGQTRCRRIAGRSLGAAPRPLLRPTLAGLECGVSARSKPALGWNVACACVPSQLVTPDGDVDGPRPRPRARGTLPLGTTGPSPSSLPRARPGAGPGRGWRGAFCRVGPWLWAAGHLPVRAFALRRRSRVHL